MRRHTMFMNRLVNIIGDNIPKLIGKYSHWIFFWTIGSKVSIEDKRLHITKVFLKNNRELLT